MAITVAEGGAALGRIMNVPDATVRERIRKLRENGVIAKGRGRQAAALSVEHAWAIVLAFAAEASLSDLAAAVTRIATMQPIKREVWRRAVQPVGLGMGGSVPAVARVTEERFGEQPSVSAPPKGLLSGLLGSLADDQPQPDLSAESYQPQVPGALIEALAELTRRYGDEFDNLPRRFNGLTLSQPDLRAELSYWAEDRGLVTETYAPAAPALFPEQGIVIGVTKNIPSRLLGEIHRLVLGPGEDAELPFEGRGSEAKRKSGPETKVPEPPLKQRPSPWQARSDVNASVSERADLTSRGRENQSPASAELDPGWRLGPVCMRHRNGDRHHPAYASVA